MVKSLPPRSEVAVEETWNLADLFESESTYQQAIIDLKEKVAAFASSKQEQMKDAQSVVDVLLEYEELLSRFVPIGAYTSLSLSTDETNDEAQLRASKFSSLASQLSSQLSFVSSELSALDEAVLKEAQQLEPSLSVYLEEIIQFIPHQLHPEARKQS